MAAWRDRFWTSRDGLKLHYRDYDGPADQPPLLCLHGLTRNSRDFAEFAERYAGQWRVIVPDFRGRGMSERDPHPVNYAPPLYAADVLKLLDQLGIADAVFVGTSLGGLVTMLIAASDEERVAAAILNDVGPELDEAGLERIETYVGKPVLFADWEAAAAAISAAQGVAHPGYGKADWLRFAQRVCREAADGIEFDYDMAIADNFHLTRGLPAIDAWPYYRALGGRPLLIVRGALSDLLSAEVAQRMLGEIPGAELATVPNVGHAPELTEPAARAAIDRLLGKVAASAAAA
ncbi:alpha/beta hydrolase [Sphingomonas sp.]|uniref:alpha/beta fold hydrolase n=1 Tax=Sphingomonas sp. TaxID=28214 RepID=UPI00286DECBD|nr:alpha/beta hydrolase [Sphingomonas sp.]